MWHLRSLLASFYVTYGRHIWSIQLCNWSRGFTWSVVPLGGCRLMQSMFDPLQVFARMLSTCWDYNRIKDFDWNWNRLLSSGIRWAPIKALSESTGVDPTDQQYSVDPSHGTRPMVMRSVWVRRLETREGARWAEVHNRYRSRWFKYCAKFSIRNVEFRN